MVIDWVTSGWSFGRLSREWSIGSKELRSYYYGKAKAPPKPSTAQRIATALDVTAADVLDGIPRPNGRHREVQQWREGQLVAAVLRASAADQKVTPRKEDRDGKRLVAEAATRRVLPAVLAGSDGLSTTYQVVGAGSLDSLLAQLGEAALVETGNGRELRRYTVTPSATHAEGIAFSPPRTPSR